MRVEFHSYSITEPLGINHENIAFCVYYYRLAMIVNFFQDNTARTPTIQKSGANKLSHKIRRRRYFNTRYVKGKMVRNMMGIENLTM